MYPHERALVKKFKGRPFVLIGVNSDDNREKLKKRMAKEGISWRSFFDGGSTNGPIAHQWNVMAWPTIYLLDDEGRIRFKDLRGSKLEKAIEKLVAKAEESKKD